MREARDEARKEIEEYKAQKEAEFKQFESEVSLMNFIVNCFALEHGLTYAAHAR